MDFSRLTFLLQSARFLFLLSYIVIISGCDSGKNIQEVEIVSSPEEINLKAEDLIQTTLEEMLQKTSKLPDSIKLKNAWLLHELYKQNHYSLIWSSEGIFKKSIDSLLFLIDSAKAYGLFPEDYYNNRLHSISSELLKDSSQVIKLDAAKWAYIDILSTSAFIQLVKDLKKGRLQVDSLLRRDTSFGTKFLSNQLQAFDKYSTKEFTAMLEPAHKGYKELKEALGRFLPTADTRKYTLIKTKDSLLQKGLVFKRLLEESALNIVPVKNPDSLTLAKAIKKYQRWKKIKEDGKISDLLIRKLNNTDKEKFIRIAITLDKYKLLPELPSEYIWVNLPNFLLEVRKDDSVKLFSRIICGKPETKTPQLSSAISDMITYPQWTIPESIIKKEILPGLKKNSGYTQKRDYSIVDFKGNEINPLTINWSKYKNAIPYKVVQGSGDANALGIMKFNFSNPYAVYLHDTNQRYLFDRKSRALSHGCVRVQKWKELAYYIIRKDSLADSLKYTPIDSVNSWLAQKKKKVIRVNQPLPLFIRYFSVEGRKGELIFHEDIYEEDNRLREKFFAKK